MFAPSQNDVRTFFCEAWRKSRAGEPLSPIETLASQWIDLHPEYHADLADLPAALAAVYQVEDGRTNPFLHLAMHLSLAEQISIDQPPGIRAAYQALRQRLEVHDAEHAVMECLGETLWKAQRAGTAIDTAGYLACLRRSGGNTTSIV